MQDTGIVRINSFRDYEKGNLYFRSIAVVHPELVYTTDHLSGAEPQVEVEYKFTESSDIYKPSFGFLKGSDRSSSVPKLVDIEGLPLKAVEYNDDGSIKSTNLVTFYISCEEILLRRLKTHSYIYDPRTTTFHLTTRDSTPSDYPLNKVFFYTNQYGDSMEFTRGDILFADKLSLIRKAYKANDSLSEEFAKLSHLTNESLVNFTLDLKSRVTVICSDTTFAFYPPAMPAAYNLQKSLFNTSTIDTVTLSDYPSELIKPLFQIYLSRTLPEPYTLNEDYIQLYYDLSDYLGFEFYANYFSKLL